MAVYFQSGQIDDGDDGMRTQLLNNITHQYAEEPLFNQLRTIEQLGYVVWSWHNVVRNVMGFWLLV